MFNLEIGKTYRVIFTRESGEPTITGVCTSENTITVTNAHTTIMGTPVDMTYPLAHRVHDIKAIVVWGGEHHDNPVYEEALAQRFDEHVDEIEVQPRHFCENAGCYCYGDINVDDCSKCFVNNIAESIPSSDPCKECKRYHEGMEDSQFFQNHDACEWGVFIGCDVE